MGIPDLPDLTQPAQLIKIAAAMLKFTFPFALVIIALGIAIAVINFSTKNNYDASVNIGQKLLKGYTELLGRISHISLIITLLIIGFFLCTTLANRYHFWEQAKISEMAENISGERLEQVAPQVRYTLFEPYSYDTQVNGKTVKVQSKREIPKYLTVSSSEISIKINQVANPQLKGKSIYAVDFSGEYQIKNTLNKGENLFFEVSPPVGYKLLQNFKLTRNSKRVQPKNPGEYSFPFYLDSGEEIKFQLTYQVQGSPRWVYNANSQLLSNFRLTALANFPNADFASGIIPTESKIEGKGTRFTWIFKDNVSVLNPFGVFTSIDKVKNVGIMPRLLILAPGVFLWWLLLLYLSIQMNLKNVVISGGVFFASILGLTYLSRITNPVNGWVIISIFMLILAGGLGTNKRSRLAALICTISGALLPLLGLLVEASGLTLSLAGLLSILWLGIRNLYQWFEID